MQYAKMIDLMQQAKQAGTERTAIVNELLYEVFDSWRAELGLGEITEEEEEGLKLAFEEGYGICTHITVQP